MEPDSEEYQHKNSGDHVNMMEGTPMYTEGHGNSTGNTDYEGDEHEHQTRPTYPTLTSATSSEYRKGEVIDVHRDLESFANDTLEVDEGIATEINITVCGHLQKGSGLNKYTVYLIKGEDRNGIIEVYRRFNEFYQLREAMKQRWPGCFIPAVPDKNVMKNDEQLVLNRQRFLNDFVRKMAKLPNLYYGEEFQALIRSKDMDISVLFGKWPKPKYEDIIVKYQSCFRELEGKEINKNTATKIISFATFLRASQAKLPTYKEMAKSLAVARQGYDQRLAGLYCRILPEYEKTCLFEYVDGKEQLMIYANSSNAKLQEHGNIAKIITKKNPYWLVYDLIKLEERDGLVNQQSIQAFLESIQSRENLELKKQEIDIKIGENERQISEISMGKSTFKSITSRGSRDQIKYRLEQQTKDLVKDRDNLIVLTDIVSALQAYITIDQYKMAKKRFYVNTLKKISGYEINFVQNMVDIWTNCQDVSEGLMRESEARNESAK